jgi:hypothetical protein
VHDRPDDYQRWTLSGIERFAEKYGFVISDQKVLGNTLSTSCLLFNIGLAEMSLALIERSRFFFLFLPILAPIVLLLNAFGFLACFLPVAESIGPVGYNVILKKHHSGGE